MAPADVLGVVPPFRVVGADVQDDRQRSRRVDTPHQGVQRELADRDTHTASALITDAEDPLPVRDHDDVHLPVGAVPQQRADVVPVWIGDEQPAVPPVDVAELLARLPDGRRVQDRQHLFDVVEEEAVEEDLVGVLERPQVDVSSQVGLVCPERLIRPAALLVERLDYRRQQSVQPERLALGLGERGALVQERSLEQVDPPRAGLRSRCDRGARGFVSADNRLMLFQCAHGFSSRLRPHG